MIIFILNHFKRDLSNEEMITILICNCTFSVEKIILEVFSTRNQCVAKMTVLGSSWYWNYLTDIG